ncbi:MAG: exodeoxyribonuclease VII large subunit [Bacteroidales bacterium]
MMPEPPQKRIYTLSELGKSLRSVLERNYAGTYWIKAEIAKLNFYPRSGHCYPELVDKSGNIVQAQMRSTIWAADYNHINKKFLETAGETLREGMEILFRASVTFHPLYGLSLQIWEVEPAFTLGQMAAEKNKAIAKLKNEGVFLQNKTLTMPLLPKKIAVISVETSKGYRDFLNILYQQSYQYAFWHYLFPSVLQGDKAVEGIMSQLRIIKKVQKQFDLVAIIRGGGGDIGLNCYDDYNLAREIALFPLPVIAGIGHSTNETIVQMVAWANKITPTDVGYFIVDRFRDFEKRVLNNSEKLQSRTKHLLNFQKQKIVYLNEKLQESTVKKFTLEKNKLTNIQNSLRLLDPSNVLKRGYSITSVNGKSITNASEIKEDDILETQFYKGTKYSKVVKDPK